MSRPVALPTRNSIRNAVGTRGKFTLAALAAGADLSVNAARANLTRHIEAGTVELVETVKHTDAEGNATRGRPSKVYRTV